MRTLSLLLLFVGAFNLVACGDDKPTDSAPPEGDSDTDADTDSDTDTDLTEPGGDIASAWSLEFDENGDATYSDLLNPGGDRDFYFIQPEVGAMIQAHTASYILDEDGQPDTVMRLYDSTGAFLTEDDDFPYWSWGTDSALYWQATDPDGYYVEILEWTDWAGQGADGGPTYEYDFYVSEFNTAAFEWADNDDMDQADAMYDTFISDTEKYAYYYWLFGEVATDQTYSLQIFGQIEEPGDADWWVFEVDEKSVGNYLQVSFWNGFTGDLAPRVSVYDPNGLLLAQTTAPGYTTGSALWYYDPGCTVKLPTVGRYYIAVEDAAGNGGDVGFFYPLIISGPWYFNTDPYEVEENNPTGLANTLNISESSSTPGYFYGGFAGALDSPTDESDNFTVLSSDTGGLAGKYLSVYVETVMHGSLLDAKVTVYKDIGGATFEELASATVSPSGESTDDPAIWDLELDGDDNIYIAVEHESGAESADASHFYFGEAVVYDKPLN
jgi:hypothetical protein